MSADRDFYRVLHVQSDAPVAIIHASYRTLMQRLKQHPDLGGNHEHATLLNEAYAVLADPERRAAYDLQRSNSASPRQRGEGGDIVDSSGRVFAANTCLFCGAPHGLRRHIERDDDCRECASPLYPAERHRLEYSGQRMLNRIPKRRGVQIYAAWPQTAPVNGEMRDISLNGMQVVTALRLQPNQIVKIDCPLLNALARVAHSERDIEMPDRWITGVEFLTLRFRRNTGSLISARA
jgi:hypothetical protein